MPSPAGRLPTLRGMDGWTGLAASARGSRARLNSHILSRTLTPNHLIRKARGQQADRFLDDVTAETGGCSGGAAPASRNRSEATYYNSHSANCLKPSS